MRALIKIIFITLCAIFTLITEGQHVSGSAPCGPPPETSHLIVPLSSLSIKEPIYVMKAEGRLFKVNLSTGKRQIISDKAFSITPSIVPSADGRWISYSGVLKDQKTTQYWLFDKRTGRNTLYHEHPAWGGSIPVFSPDSKTVALFANYDSRWPSPKGVGLYLIETETVQSSFIGNPATVATPAHEVWAFSEWSRNGEELLLMIRNYQRGQTEVAVEYLSYNIAKKSFGRVSGKYNREKYMHEFYRYLFLLIPTHEGPYIQSKKMHYNFASPDGRWIASINNNLELKVSSKNGESRNVSVGKYDHCTGVNIWINGWLNNHLMIFTHGYDVYVFDAITARMALMFSSKDRPDAFFW